MSQGMTIPPELDSQMTPEVRAFVKLLLGRIDQLTADVADLKRQLKASSRFDHPAQPEAKPDPVQEGAKTQGQPSAKRKRGGQPGHAKHERPLIPTAQCDDVQVLKPNECRRCGTMLSGDDPDPLRHQVYELPEIKLHVTEYQRHRLTCPCCKKQTCAELPAGVPAGQSGVRLVAFTALLMGMFRQSKRRVSAFCETLLGHSMSSGLVVKLQQQASESLAACHEQLVAAIPSQPAVWADETPMREANQKAWIWTVVATTFTLFRVRLTKAAHVIKELLGEEFSGVVTSDRAKTYHWIWRHQWCWAHLKRDFEKMAARAGQAGAIGGKLLECTHQLFHYWHRVRDDTITRRGFESLITRLRRDVERLLAEGSCCADSATAATCSELLAYSNNLWMFHYCKNVEPTNNAAERSLRHAVIWRHLSFGTQSAHGSRFVERLLTMLETCRQQKRCPFQFLCKAIKAHQSGLPMPSLLTGA